MKSIYGESEQFMVKDNQCFVIMPFSESWSNPLYENVKKAVKGLGIDCIRGDEARGKIIVKDIWEKINESRIIITDVSKKNSNVFYELGMAHTLDKDVIIISQDEADVPFDITPFRRIIYENSPDGYEKLEEELTCFIKSIFLVDNFGNKINDNDNVIVYVSSGGTCRCAIANVITRYNLKEKKKIKEIDENYKIKSLSAALDKPSDTFASDGANFIIKEKFNRSLDDHKTLNANFVLLERADLILPMSERLCDQILKNYPDLKSKLCLFTEFFESKGNIEDPYKKGENEYRKCFNQINDLIAPKFDKILNYKDEMNSNE